MDETHGRVELLGTGELGLGAGPLPFLGQQAGINVCALPELGSAARTCAIS